MISKEIIISCGSDDCMTKEQILAKLISIKSVLSYIEILCKKYDDIKEDCKNHKEIDILFFEQRIKQINSNNREKEITEELLLIEKDIKLLSLQKSKDEMDIKNKDFLLIKDSRYYDKMMIDRINFLMEQSIKDEIKEINLAIERLYEKKRNLSDLIIKNNENSVIIRKSCEDAIDTLNKLIQIKTKEMDLLLKKIQMIFNDLCKTVKNFLHHNDFDKLERIYFYIVTGRADTIKDALNLTDAQIRHEEMVDIMKQAVSSICSAINTATTEIVDSIRENTEEICFAINNGVEIISGNFSNISSEIKKMDENVSKSMLEILDNQKEIVDSNLLHTSLLKEQNSTCEKILKHYRYVNGLSGDL